MPQNPKVSIIIPIYNGEKYLTKAIESAIKQSLSEIEIIIVDDGSTDNTSSLLEQYSKKDDRINIYSHHANLGLGPSRNLGIDKASGKFLYFLDVDDYLHLNALESLYEQAMLEDLDILQSKYIKKKGEKKKILPQDLTPLPKPVNGIEYFHQDFFVSPPVWAKLYKRKFIDNNNIRFKNMYYEDMLFTFESIVKAKRVNNTLWPTYIYQTHEQSITAGFTNKHMEDYIYVLDELQRYFLRNELTDKKSTFPIHYFLFLARLSDLGIKKGNNNQKKHIKAYVEKQAKKYNKFVLENQTYPILKKWMIQFSPYKYALLSNYLKPKKHK